MRYGRKPDQRALLERRACRRKRRHQSHQRADGRRLAHAVAADQCDDFSRADVECDIE